MVLIVGGQPLAAAGSDGRRLLAAAVASPELQQAALQFLTCAGQSESIAAKCVHVLQGEAAGVSLAAETPLLGASDFTTCVAAVLLSPTAQAASVCHHDEGTTSSSAALDRAAGAAAAPGATLLLAGGYCDSRGIGARISCRLLQYFHRRPEPLELRLCCVGELNTSAAGGPCCTTLAFDPATGAAFPPPAGFPHRGPMLPARAAQAWLQPSGSVRSVYDPTTGRLALRLAVGGPSSNTRQDVEMLQQLSDELLLRCCSTSPDHEPGHFVEDMRAACSWLLQQQGPAQQVVEVFEWGAAGWQWREQHQLPPAAAPQPAVCP